MPSYYGNKPYSAPAPRSIPTYTDDLEQGVLLANWQNQISNSIQNVAPQATPLNFAITNGTNQLALTWSPVAGSDGYEILKSPSGSFTTDLQIIPVKNANQNSYVDSTVNGGQKSFYRIRTTSGTKQNPQSQRGPESGVVSHTAILSSDTTTKSTTKLDQFTTDTSRAGAKRGNYGAFKVAGTGVPSRVTGAGQRMGNTSGASGPAAGTKSSGVRSISPTGSVASSSSSSGSSPSGGGSSALPGGNQGSIQYNAGGIFGGSAATVDAAGDISALTIATTTATTTALIATTVTATTATIQTLTAPAAIITTATVQTLIAPTAIITAATIATATIAAMINTAATITTATVQTLVATTTATVSGLAISGQVVENGVRTSGAGLVPIVYAIKSVTATGSQANSTTLPVGGIYEAIGFFGHITNTTLTLGNATVSWYDGGSGSLMVASPQLLLVSSGAVVSTIATTNTTGSGTAYFTPIAFNATATTFAWGIVCNTSVGVYEYALVVKQLF